MSDTLFPLPAASIQEQPEVTLHQIGTAAGIGYMVWARAGNWGMQPGPDQAGSTWERSINMGRCYLTGQNTSMAKFLANHTSPLSDWQKLAYTWARQNPGRTLHVDSRRLEYEVYQRGEYVEFGLPHQDKGGERHWICRDGRTKVLVNVD